VSVIAVATRKLTKSDIRLAARCAAVASMGAAVIHFAVTPMHWRDWLPSGVFFAVLASFQLVWGLVAWSRQNAWVLAAGIAANVGAAGLWVMSCISGPPVGPSAGQPEPVGAAGICVLLLQLYVVMGAGWAWSRTHQPEEVSGFGRAMVLMGANTIVAGAVTLGLAASLQGHHHHHHGAAAEAQEGHHSHHEAHMDGDAHMESHMDGAHMDGDAHMDADGHMDGDHHPSAPEAPPAGTVAPEEQLPVTDMSLEVDGDHHGEPGVPAGGVAQPAPEASAPPAAVPAAKPAPAQSSSSAVESEGDGDADGHQHHHDD